MRRQFFASLTEDYQEVDAFYRIWAPKGFKYPRDIEWLAAHIGRTIYFIGAHHKGKLVGIQRIVQKKRRFSFMIEENSLVLKEGGPFVETGGTIIHPEFRREYLPELLCATALAYWFSWPIEQRESCYRNLWTRAAGKKNDRGEPIFWELVGASLTGISHEEILHQPFDADEEIIFEKWPKEPIPLSSLPPVILSDVLGKPDRSVLGYFKKFPLWGFHPTNEYTLNSLMVWSCCTQEQLTIPEIHRKKLFITLLGREI